MHPSFIYTTSSSGSGGRWNQSLKLTLGETDTRNLNIDSLHQRRQFSILPQVFKNKTNSNTKLCTLNIIHYTALWSLSFSLDVTSDTRRFSLVGDLFFVRFLLHLGDCLTFSEHSSAEAATIF